MGLKVGARGNKQIVDSPSQTLSDAQTHFVESQNHCALCNTPLIIRVESYLEDFYLREEAECPHCHVKTRVKNHKMQ
jgi:hypothetical protein